MNDEIQCYCLEDILKLLGSNKPFRKDDKPTSTGMKAYGKLTNILYGLERMGVINDSNSIVEELDEILTGHIY